MKLTPEQVQAQAAALRKQSRSSRVMALQHSGGWSGPERLNVAGEEHQVIPCVSDLQMREALGLLEGSGRPGILLCDVDSSTLGDDVLARLVKRRVHRPQTEEILRELFSARQIDARVLSCKPLAETLIQRGSMGAFPPVPGGVLELTSAWRALLRSVLGQEVVDVKFRELIRWTTRPVTRAALVALDRPLRDELAGWMSLTEGGAPRNLFRVLESELESDVIAVGLLLGLLLAAEQRGVPDAGAAAARLEQYFGNETVSATSKQAWYQAAEELLRSLAETEAFQANEILQNLDRLLERVRLQEHARLSDYSNRGLDQRFGDAGDAILKAIESGAAADLESAQSTVEYAARHFLAPREGVRLRRLQMAVRLIAWRNGHLPKLSNDVALSELVDHYAAEGGFVEWARNAVTESDPNPRVKEALRAILKSGDGAWTRYQQMFVERLREATAQGGEIPGAILIEDLLHEVIGPVARRHPVLLVVLDGMGMAAFQELLADLQRRNWVRIEAPIEGSAPPVLATIPSVTECSRGALLAGRLPAGGDEKSDFARNDRLFQQTGGQVRPHLFLKGDLGQSERPGLSGVLAQTIANERCRLVGVVVNAIDDSLGSVDQMSFAWTLDQIAPLHELLRLAAEAGRIVILTSDHGHVLESGSVKVPQPWPESGDRHRRAGGSLAEGEAEFTGERIRAATRQDSVVVLGGEKFRYQAKRRGYHGGVSPAELVLPCALLRSGNSELGEAWRDLPPFEPSWWSGRTTGARAAAEAPRPVAQTRPRRASGQGELFDGVAPSPAGAFCWIDALLKSDIYRQQTRQAVRGAPAEDQIKRFLALLEQRNGRALRAHLAQELELPLLRVDGMVQNYRRLLNVDGYDVLSYDSTSETIVLNIALLRSQFEI